MLTEERRRHILNALHRDGKVVALEMSGELGVSSATVRRDLQDLERDGLLQRVHGGALPRTPGVDAGFTDRQQQAPSAKAAIADAAARLVENGQVILLDGGTTTLQVAQRLPWDLRATVVTNSPPIAVALGNHPHIDVIILGGRLYKHAMSAVGGATLEDLQMVRADVCLLGIGGLHPEVGISTNSLEEAHVKRMMIANSAEVVAVAAPDKLGAALPYIVAPITALTHLVTERSAPEVLLAAYEAADITVVRA
ncbi:MAG: DeoR/GlpR family DNA-binding transcription regulator [Chloroflexia bacterium]